MMKDSFGWEGFTLWGFCPRQHSHPLRPLLPCVCPETDQAFALEISKTSEDLFHFSSMRRWNGCAIILLRSVHIRLTAIRNQGQSSRCRRCASFWQMPLCTVTWGPNTVGTGKRVEIRVLRDRLMIKSPGGLEGLPTAQLESTDLTKSAVNQRVYEIAKCLETPDGRPIIEGEGGGIPEVYHAMRGAGKPDPRFFDNGVEFSVSLFRNNRYDDEESAFRVPSLAHCRG
ncbi:ATP-binding protein [Corynebacterium flavescens]|uniref:ATP-binding protein n=2 Tax=Corynebacterium flavescens TaxID=28028 RepID=UPI003FCFDD7A